jgi:carbon-monoxide dehydrogenase small subunit
MSDAHHVRITINDAVYAADVESRKLLVHFIREVAHKTGTKVGCDTSMCGACTVILDGRLVKSCTMLAVQADGLSLQTVEGLASEGRLHPLQEAFAVEYGLQCGFCTPGMLLTAVELLGREVSPSGSEIRAALGGNLCRCTGYESVVASIRRAAAQ